MTNIHLLATNQTCTCATCHITAPPVKLTSKEAAQLLTNKGFIRWAEGKKLRPQDFKREEDK